MEGFFNEEMSSRGFAEEFYNNSLYRSIEELDNNVTDVEEYIRSLDNIVHLIIDELKEVNSETRHLFGKPGDTDPWVFNENIRLKMYRMIQKLGDFLPVDEDVRIKRDTTAKTVNTYIGILKLKTCMTVVQIFASSFKRILPMKAEFTRFQANLTFIFNTAMEIDSELGKALDSNRIKNFLQS